MAPIKYTVSAGSTLIMERKKHDKKMILLDAAAGSTVTLPAATGSGARYKFAVSVVATSGNHVVKVANATDVIQGICVVATTTSDNAEVFQTSATSDTITLNRTTTGSVIQGETFEITDIAAGVFIVNGLTSATGSEQTPFSAGV